MNNLTYDKPFKTYDEQIEILKSRNIDIDDYNFARQILSSLSYYTIINGYKNTFLSVVGTDNFVKGTNFKQLYTLHTIDTDLNSVILKNILFVERYLKTRLSYLVSEKYGVYTDTSDLSNTNPDDYLYRNHYSSTGNGRNNILKAIKESLSSNRINASVAHYANSKNHIPAWILVTNIPFGLTIKWYSILKANDKERICSEFISTNALSVADKKEFIPKTFSLLKEYRNKIAHSNRTFNVSGLPVLPKRQLLDLSFNVLTTTEYNNNLGKSDLLAVILSCFILIDNRYILTNFLRDLVFILEPYKDIQMNGKSVFEIFGLPKNLFERLTHLYSEKFAYKESDSN